MKKQFNKIAKIALVLVYLVIIAGAVVRMTGSGMGCPDWPKCFGYIIPPTGASVLEWNSNKNFEEGQVIIYNESLKVAKSDFQTTDNYHKENWEDYTKHDYAIFNVWHTWIEYINRLFGALAGLATLLVGILSFYYWKENKYITLFSWLVVFGMGFQAWLGATVVYSVLEPVKITTHMVMALLIVALQLYIIHQTTKNKNPSQKSNKITYWLLFAIILTLVQIVLGTQVRQFIDHQIDIFGEEAKNLWLQNPELNFYIHRSFSILVVLLNIYIAYLIKKEKLLFTKINWVLILIGIEVVSGIAMYYFDFPFGTQPLHLVIASLLFGVQFYLVLEALNTSKTLKTS